MKGFKKSNGGMTMNDTVKALKELMDGWNVIETAAKKQFPTATAEELYQICKSAMNQSLGITIF